MPRKWLAVLLGLALGGVLFNDAQPAHAQHNPYQLQRWYYYPYYYFPHNYWPAMGPRYPERPFQHYLPPPAYMAYPPFQEPNWRYSYFEPKHYYQGFHFWLDQF